ncbi:MAG: Spy/CpxP family protein refolding chaperone [Rhodopila sp.]|nr:Spy/CpxP family protein refolding chaperone [Rhodopila sp.]
MTIKSTSYTAALLASLLLPAIALPVGAFAQTQAPAGGPSATSQPKAPAAKPTSMTERVEQHITDLHTQLHITPAQQTEWDQFAQVMRENAKDMNQALEQRGAGFASMNAAENMQSWAQIAQQHAQDMQKLATAFQALYGSMSDDQKKNADVVFRAHGDHPAHKKG